MRMYVHCRKSGGAAWHPPLTSQPHTSQLEGTLWLCYHNFITRSEAEQQVHDRSNSRVQALGRGDRGWAATEYHLKTAPGPGVRPTAVAIVAGRLPLCACRARQTAHWMSRQIHAGKQQRRSRWSGYCQCQTNFSGVCRQAETKHHSKE